MQSNNYTYNLILDLYFYIVFMQQDAGILDLFSISRNVIWREMDWASGAMDRMVFKLNWFANKFSGDVASRETYKTQYGNYYKTRSKMIVLRLSVH